MSVLLQYMVPTAVALVFVVLVGGLWTMLRGNNPNLSQTLMRWRVGLQFAAIVIIMAAIFIKRGGA